MEVDFTSSLYLGFRHGSRSLKPWPQLTTGRPAVLAEPVGSEAVAIQLARLQGCERATLARSSLHLFWDLFGMLANDRVAIFLDAGAYPIARWGVERAAARGVPVGSFPHRDAETLGRLLRREVGGRRPVVVSDGMCTACGCAVPIAEYLESIRRAGGLLVMDDTQPLGVLGHSPGPGLPYGLDGGGSLQNQNVFGPDVLIISSLAKGFGAPLAVLSGSSEMIRRFEIRSETRVHCSPPSAADVYAAEHALKLNAERGDALRGQLVQRVLSFRRHLAKAGFSATGGLFPVQTLKGRPDLDARQTHERLLSLGVRSVLRRSHMGREVQISFILTAQHRPDEIEYAIHTLTRAIDYSIFRVHSWSNKSKLHDYPIPVAVGP